MQGITNLMPYQLEPFNGDTFIQEKFLELKIKHGLNKAIETGSCYGGTTLWLLQNFAFVATIEYNQEYFNIMIKRCAEFQDNLMAIQGDSSIDLYSIITGITQMDKAIFFLDAHWGENCPLLAELKQIADASIKPVIAIHDFKVPDAPEDPIHWDEYHGQAFDFEYIKPSLDQIYGLNGYEISYNNPVTAKGAARGIIYIEPIK